MLKGYRTIIFNVIMTVLLMIRLWQPDIELPSEGDISAGLDLIDKALVFVWGLGNLIIRIITDTPIFRK